MKMQVITIDQARAQGSTSKQIAAVAAFHRRAAGMKKGDRRLIKELNEHLRLSDYFSNMAMGLRAAR